MTKTKVALYGLALLVVAVILWFHSRSGDRRVDSSIVSVQLPANDQEKLIVNEHTHTITEVTRNAQGKVETKKVYLPPVADVEESNGGSIRVTGRIWGTELSPSAGILYGSDLQLRGALSLGVLYFARFELGLGGAMGASTSSARLIATLQYNVYNNIMLGAYVDNHNDAGVIATLKF